MPKPDKKKIIIQKLKEIEIPVGMYLPTNPDFKITSIVVESGSPMQSAAKVPILVAFNCEAFEGPDEFFSKNQNLESLSTNKSHLLSN